MTQPTITKLTKITNQVKDTGKFKKLLKESRKRSFTNITENTGNNNYSKHKENNKSSEYYWPKITNQFIESGQGRLHKYTKNTHNNTEL